MNQKSFLDLLSRYQAGECSEAEKAWIDNWYHKLNSTNLNELSVEDLEDMQEKVWLKIIEPKPKVKKLWRNLSIAASITIAFFISGLYLANRNYAERSFVNENDGLNLISKTNEGNCSIVVSLSDQTKVTLEPKASIIYPKDFATDKRTIYLKGNAFFAVSKNPKKPFYVYHQNLVVKVLGTSFFVRSPVNDQPAQVSVRTGKVQVNENGKSTLFNLSTKRIAPVLLTPNQKAVLADHSLKKTLVEKPVPLAVAYHLTNTVKYNFKEEQLKTIFKTLSDAYGIVIKCDNEEILTYTFTGDLSGKGLYEQLDLICGSITSKYRIVATDILISK